MLERRQAKGKNTPALDNRPDLFLDLVEYWEAFWELRKRRPRGQGIVPIPISEIVSWLDLSLIKDLESRRDYLRWITALDNEWAAFAQKKVDHANSVRSNRRP